MNPMTDVLLDGRYELLAPLAAGGMAELYRARDHVDHRDVAVKLLTLPRTGDERLVARFRREYQVCSRLVHPNIVRLFGAGRAPDGSLFYAMELIDARNLFQVVSIDGPLPLERTMHIARQLLEAFMCFHDVGVVHRDLKPSNVLVGADDHVTVVDFGLVYDPRLTELTATGTVLGTPYYLSPEQLLAKDVDPRSDLFQFGLIVHECLTGAHAVPGTTSAEKGANIICGKHNPLREARPDLSADVELFVENCLRTERDQRYPSARAALADLDRLTRGDTVVSRGPSGASSTEVPEHPEPPRRSTSSTRRRRQPTASSPAASHGPSTADGETTRPRTRRLVPLLFVVVAAVVALVALRPHVQVDVTLSSLELVPGVDRVTVTWTTSAPCRSAVEVHDRGAVRVVRSNDAVPTTAHRVVVTGLAEDSTYEFRVVLPSDERSLPQTCRTERLDVEVTACSFVPPRGLELDLRCTVDGTTRVGLSRRTKSTLWFEAVPAPSGGRRVLLEGFDDRVTAMTVEITVEPGSLVSAAFETQLQRRVVRCLHRLAEVRPETYADARILSQLEGTMGTSHDGIPLQGPHESDEAYAHRIDAYSTDHGQAVRDSRAAAASSIDERLRASPVLPDYREAVMLSPLVFRGSLVPFDERRRLYRHLTDLLTLYLFCRFNACTIEALDPRPDFGLFAVTADPPAEGTHESVVVHQPADPLTLRMRLPLYDDGIPDRWHGTFVIDDGPEPIRHGCIELTTTSFLSMCLRVRINRTTEFLVWDAPMLHGGSSKPRSVYQWIPGECLRPGSNDIELAIDPLFNLARSLKIKLTSMTVHLTRDR